MRAEDRIRAMDFWSGPVTITPLGGGITNVNAVVQDGTGKYVVRLGADIPEHGIMRWNEVALARAAADAGISPALRHAAPGLLVFDFVEAIALTPEDLHDPQVLAQAVDLVARVHRDLTPRLRGPVLTFWVFHVLRDYAGYLRDHASPHVDKLDGLLATAAELEEAVGPVRLVLGHNDLLPANILQGGDRLWLVDWEYGGFNSALFDLGGLASNAGLGAAAEQGMLARYLGHAPDAAYLRRYGAMKCASLLREAMWSMVSELTSDIEFDYPAYTAENLAQFQAALTAWKEGA
ncbi:phosphotransferase [Actibacterium ureilyticum]|uniref:phosphotransferase n=1 Tax=Actibacterium ureilyticum TaxID=1590614 RepID=UPI000BAAC18C|nr:phosphotransferase [Actibacterium ureilyticum]